MTQCTLCNYHDRATIERKIATRELSMTDAARIVGCDKASISRHMTNHLTAKIAKAAEKMEISDGINAINVLVEREKVVEDQIKRALAIDDVPLSIKWTLKAVETGLKVTELNARLTGQLSGPTTQINLLSDPTFIWLRDTIMTNLDVESQLKLTAALQEIAEREERNE